MQSHLLKRKALLFSLLSPQNQSSWKRRSLCSSWHSPVFVMVKSASRLLLKTNLIFTDCAPFTLNITCDILGLPTSRIVNGTAAADKQYPYQVSVLNNGRHLCGGTILNKRHILTAAHCFQ